VSLERAGALWFDGEVQAYDEGDLLVTADSATVEVDGADLVPMPATLVWTTDRGLFHASVEAALEGEVWRVRIIDDTKRTQRRAYVRLPMGTPMTLSHPYGSTRGILVDLSEAAVRVRLDERKAPKLRARDEVRAAFTLHRTGFMLRGRVLREQASDEPGTVDVVVMLDVPARTANDLRRGVVFEQVERQRDKA
jgi:hypothetical protein